MSRIGKAVGHVAITGSRSLVLALARVMTLLLVGALVAGCNSAASTSSPVTSPSTARSASSTSASGPVVGLIALGHSALTGENSDPSAPGQEVRKNSWATGTNPAVRSIYERMLEVRPKTSGQVANLAEAGAPAARLAEQARQALARVPLPATRDHPDDRRRPSVRRHRLTSRQRVRCSGGERSSCHHQGLTHDTGPHDHPARSPQIRAERDGASDQQHSEGQSRL